MSITRRVFLRNGAMAVVGTAAVPAFLARAALADAAQEVAPSALSSSFSGALRTA